MNRPDPIDVFNEVTRQQADRIVAPDELRRAVGSLIAEAGAPKRRVRRRSVLVVGAGVLVVGAGIGANALLTKGQPTRPEHGVDCYSEPRTDSAVVVLPPNVDPLGGCSELWRRGDLPDPGNPLGATQPVPSLVACVGTGGTVGVYPGPPDLCVQLDLVPADSVADSSTGAATDLANRVADEINLADCAPLAVVEQRALTILGDLGLEAWTVVPSPGADTAACVKAEVDSPGQQIRLHAF